MTLFPHRASPSGEMSLNEICGLSLLFSLSLCVSLSSQILMSAGTGTVSTAVSMSLGPSPVSVSQASSWPGTTAPA